MGTWAVPLVGEGDLRPRHAELHPCSLPASVDRCGGGPASSVEPVNCRRQFRKSIGLEEWPRDSRRATEEHEAPCIRNCSRGDDLDRASCPRANRCSESMCEFRRPIHIAGGITSLRPGPQPDRDLLRRAEMHYLARRRARADVRRELGVRRPQTWFSARGVGMTSRPPQRKLHRRR